MAAITLRGRRRSYVFNFARTNAMCLAEEATGLAYGDIVAALKRPRTPPAIVRALMGAALLDPASATETEIVRIVRDIGGAKVIRAAARGLQHGD